MNHILNDLAKVYSFIFLEKKSEICNYIFFKGHFAAAFADVFATVGENAKNQRMA